MALYDTIGRTYDTTRRADPSITKTLARLLDLKSDAKVLDVGCGTGNYTVALQNLGARTYGLELTTTMLDKARPKSHRVRWIQGDADALPFRDRCFDGAVATVTIHHWKSLRPGFDEIFRVLDSGRFVIFTGDHAQMKAYWLCDYFPKGTAAALKQMPPAEYVMEQLARVGFIEVRREAWEVPREIQDWFLYAGKYRPEIYLDPAVRAGISFFAPNITPPEETAEGCARLGADIKSGRIEKVMEKYRHDLGDYLFVYADKK
ncbi:MAG TPA: class I SAM-dependent methyltransferase [Candidatus Binataceae bacterium]|nr:class I SAM-dependent methyltransferase [Candidatus Binataceae bacterium]